MLLPKFILIINARNGKIPSAQGFRETASGASRHQPEEEAHPRAAALKCKVLRSRRTTALRLQVGYLERMKYNLGWYREVNSPLSAAQIGAFYFSSRYYDSYTVSKVI